jgi:hypothetical protein
MIIPEMAILEKSLKLLERQVKILKRSPQAPKGPASSSKFIGMEGSTVRKTPPKQIRKRHLPSRASPRRNCPGVWHRPTLRRDKPTRQHTKRKMPPKVRTRKRKFKQIIIPHQQKLNTPIAIPLRTLTPEVIRALSVGSNFTLQPSLPHVMIEAATQLHIQFQPHIRSYSTTTQQGFSRLATRFTYEIGDYGVTRPTLFNRQIRKGLTHIKHSPWELKIADKNLGQVLLDKNKYKSMVLDQLQQGGFLPEQILPHNRICAKVRRLMKSIPFPLPRISVLSKKQKITPHPVISTFFPRYIRSHWAPAQSQPSTHML